MPSTLLPFLLLAAVFATIGASPAAAHPGIGITRDSRGNIYYTDLQQVWKVAPDGSRSIAVPKVHTHELYLDAQDNLFGEHLWYEGEATGRWGHRVWRRAPDGTVQDIIPARPGFLDDHDDFRFAHDRLGAMYWIDRGPPARILKRLPGGPVVTVTTTAFRNIRWMTVTPDGVVYLIDLHDLVRVAPNGTVLTVAKNLAGNFEQDHAIMGLWTDQAGSVYAAVASDREVKRVSPEGRITVVARTQPGWIPTGGLVAPNGDLWLLEYSDDNQARVRRIARGEW